MKFLVSSSNLANKLRLLSETEFVKELVLETRHKMSIVTNEKTISVEVEAIRNETVSVKQDNRRWDWVKQLMCQVSDQPIVIDAHENVTNIIFQY